MRKSLLAAAEAPVYPGGGIAILDEADEGLSQVLNLNSISPPLTLLPKS